MIERIGGLLDWSALTALAHPDLRQLANLTSGWPVTGRLAHLAARAPITSGIVAGLLVVVVVALAGWLVAVLLAGP